MAQFEVEEGKYQLAVKKPDKARDKFEDVSKTYPGGQQALSKVNMNIFTTLGRRKYDASFFLWLLA